MGEVNCGLGPAEVAFRDSRQQRLFELRMIREQGRRQNNKEVIEEKKRMDLQSRQKAGKVSEPQPKAEGDEEETEESNGRAKKTGESKAGTRKDYLTESAAAVGLREEKKRKKQTDSFGWNVFNQDSLYRAHKKRIARTPFSKEDYEVQKETLGEDFYDKNDFLDHQPSEAGKERLAAMVHNQLQNRKKYSRRRMFVEDEDVSYINERNRVFNRKLERAFGEHSLEIKQNLERGTAL